jgi:hypothetical protein
VSRGALALGVVLLALGAVALVLAATVYGR